MGIWNLKMTNNTKGIIGALVLGVPAALAMWLLIVSIIVWVLVAVGAATQWPTLSTLLTISAVCAAVTVIINLIRSLGR
jgi:hypothetical protein